MIDTDILHSVKDLKAFLKGTWWLTRRLDDRRAGQQGSLKGSAVFSPDLRGGRAVDLHYAEKGLLEIGTPDGGLHSGPATQVHLYAFPAQGRAEISFADGRPFHDLDLTTGRWAATHLCDPDRYEGEFSAEDADTLRIFWRVSGPRKDLTLDSTYRRAL